MQIINHLVILHAVHVQIPSFCAHFILAGCNCCCSQTAKMIAFIESTIKGCEIPEAHLTLKTLKIAQSK